MSSLKDYPKVSQIKIGNNFFKQENISLNIIRFIVDKKKGILRNYFKDIYKS